MSISSKKGLNIVNEFLHHLDSITNTNILETMREGLASRAHSSDLTWHDRNFIYAQIQAIVNRMMQLEHH